MSDLPGLFNAAFVAGGPHGSQIFKNEGSNQFAEKVGTEQADEGIKMDPRDIQRDDNPSEQEDYPRNPLQENTI